MIAAKYQRYGFVYMEPFQPGETSPWLLYQISARSVHKQTRPKGLDTVETSVDFKV